MKMNLNKVFWFTGGFAMGITLISMGHAALPKRATPMTAPSAAIQPAQANTASVTEMKAPKVTAPDLEQDYSKLTNLEARYAESWDQQQRLRSATSGVAQADQPAARIAPKAKKKVRQ